MKTDYICDYLHNSGNICGKKCTRQSGCRLHFQTKKRYPCKKCDKPTGSTSGLCHMHVGSYYQKQYINKIRYKAQLYDQCRPSES